MKNLAKNSMFYQPDYFPSKRERSLLAWFSRVAALPGRATIRMAVLLASSAMRLKRKQYIPVTPQATRGAGMCRVAAWRATQELENAGLIIVKHKRGSHPLVTIV